MTGFDLSEPDRESGVLFCDWTAALRDHPRLVEQYVGSVIAPDAAWAADRPGSSAAFDRSPGAFVYVPPGVRVHMPLLVDRQGRSGEAPPFERTLVIADEGSQLDYVAGCSAPIHTSDARQTMVVEVVVKAFARVTHSTIVSWSSNVDSLVLKAASVEANGRMDWVGCAVGANRSVEHATIYLVGENACGEVRSAAYATAGQYRDISSTFVHSAARTRATSCVKVACCEGGFATGNAGVRLENGDATSSSSVTREALLLDGGSNANWPPVTVSAGGEAGVDGESSTSMVGEAQLSYLMSRGLSAEQSVGLIVNGFFAPVTKALATEFAVEWNRLIDLTVAGAVG